jgi:hypothetical protein
MKDIKSFCKLFDLNVPNFNEFDYYINQYKKLWRWKNIDDLITLYESAELEIEDIYQFKLDKSNEAIEFLKKSRAYNELNDDNLITDLPTNKNVTLSEDKKYLSIDLKMANWQVLKKYDPFFLNELGDTYSDFLNKFDIHPIFHKSKHFRQYIFGNINPKRQVRAQRVMIEDVINKLSGFDGLTLEFIKYDEVIFSYDDIKKLQKEVLLDIIKNESYNVKIFKTKITEDFRINTYLDFFENELYKELTGCDGRKYFIYLKKYIFNEPIDIRDLYFRCDGDLAIWGVENLKIELND